MISLLTWLLLAQQVPDPAFAPPLDREPRFRAGAGPLVRVDQAHFNFHTASGRYQAFAKVLQQDGYRVESNTAPFSRRSLTGTHVLVIANALHRDNVPSWSRPRESAFTAEEIRELVTWIREDGGSLFLISDHRPFAGAVLDLAKEFGAEFTDGYVGDSTRGTRSLPDLFTKAAGTLGTHPVVTRGVESVGTFTGSAFRFADQKKDVQPILVLGAGFQSVLRDPNAKVEETTPRIPVAGWLQGAVLHFGKGRVALFGEAAMFSAQLAGPERRPMGMNHPNARENPRLLLNLLAWMTGQD